jgi:selenocysteine-specific translation elongation factor
VIVGTSGHIDHGKTALVRALTGAREKGYSRIVPNPWSA